jgi:hypothetical protein
LAGGGTATLTLQTVSGSRQQLTTLAVAGATATTDLTVTVPGGVTTTVGSLTICGTAMHDVNMPAVTLSNFVTTLNLHDLNVGDVQGTVLLTGGGHDAHFGNIGTTQSPAIVVLSGGFNNLTMKDVLSCSHFTLLGSGNDITFGNIAAGAVVSLGIIGQTGAVHDITGGNIAGNLLAYDSIHNGSVQKISGLVYLQAINGTFTTTSKPDMTWTGTDLRLVDGGDIQLARLADTSRVRTAH